MSLDIEHITTSILRSQLLILRVVRTIVVAEGLTMQQFGTLRLLNRGGPLSMKALSTELAVSPPVVTGLVDRLEIRGFVRRAPRVEDRRRIAIELTIKGKTAFRKIQARYRAQLGALLGRSLSPSERETLSKLLTKLTETI